MNPIIVHGSTSSPPRNCVILQDGHRYCEDTDMSYKELGVGLLVTCVLLTWIGGSMLWTIEGSWLNAGWRVVISFLLPMLIVGIILVLQ